jgi:hypothetical protein
MRGRPGIARASGFAALAILTGCATTAPDRPGDTTPASVYAGVAGVELVDAGVLVVEGDPRIARTEVFEYLRRPDGGYTLVETVTAGDGRYRVRARLDYDEDWNAVSAGGVGLYDADPVDVSLTAAGGEAVIRVRGPGLLATPEADCPPGCFLNMSPTALPMFVMTRHYDRKAGGEQTFHWASQDLDRRYTMSGGTARLAYVGRQRLPHGEDVVVVDHYTFLESLPTPDGGRFELTFDLWTDDAHRPLGFRVVEAGGRPGRTVGFRRGYEALLPHLTAADRQPETGALGAGPPRHALRKPRGSGRSVTR